MSRSKDPDNYPPQFKPLLLAAYNSRKPLYWTQASKGKAQNIKQQIYAYIRAVKGFEQRHLVTPELQLGKKFALVTIRVCEHMNEPAVELVSKVYAPEYEAINELIEGLDCVDHEAEAYKREVAKAMEQSPHGEPEELPEGNTPSEVDIDKLFSSSTETIGDTQ